MCGVVEAVGVYLGLEGATLRLGDLKCEKRGIENMELT